MPDDEQNPKHFSHAEIELTVRGIMSIGGRVIREIDQPLAELPPEITQSITEILKQYESAFTPVCRQLITSILEKSRHLSLPDLRDELTVAILLFSDSDEGKRVERSLLRA